MRNAILGNNLKRKRDHSYFTCDCSLSLFVTAVNILPKMDYVNGFVLQGRVVRKPVNVNPGLNVNCSITFSSVKMVFTRNVWCSLRLLQHETAGQTK